MYLHFDLYYSRPYYYMWGLLWILFVFSTHIYRKILVGSILSDFIILIFIFIEKHYKFRYKEFRYILYLDCSG